MRRTTSRRRQVRNRFPATFCRGLPRGWSPPEPFARRGGRRRLLYCRKRPAAGGRDGHDAPAGAFLRSDETARLEAALFLAREPLSPRRLAKLARLDDGTRARALLRELKRLHEASGAAFRVEQIAGGFMLMTRGPFGPWVRRLLGTPPETRLSAAALETLAIVAYRQPVTRAEIEAIRGVGCEDMIRQLMERDLVAIGGRTEELGRPNYYGTTRRFLQFFGLSRIEDLPPLAPLATIEQPASADPADGPETSAA